jgi:hypothetical protein
MPDWLAQQEAPDQEMGDRVAQGPGGLLSPFPAPSPVLAFRA